MAFREEAAGGIPRRVAGNAGVDGFDLKSARIQPSPDAMRPVIVSVRFGIERGRPAVEHDARDAGGLGW